MKAVVKEGYKECPSCFVQVTDIASSCECGYSFSKTKKENTNHQKVEVVNFDMEFGSMVSFMVKWAIASIPAMIILFLVGTFLVSVFGISIFALFN